MVATTVTMRLEVPSENPMDAFETQPKEPTRHVLITSTAGRC